MKKLFLFLMVALTAMCVSCSSDDDDVSFDATEIIAVPQTARFINEFYQNQIHYATLNSKEDGVTVTWNDSEQGEYTGDTLYFFPLKTGEHTITATLHKNGSTKQLTKTIEIERNSSGTFAIQGQRIEDAWSNEVNYALLVYGTQPKNMDYHTEHYKYYVSTGNNGSTHIWHEGIVYKFYERQKNIFRAYECDNAEDEITRVYCQSIPN